MSRRSDEGIEAEVDEGLYGLGVSVTFHGDFVTGP